MPAPKGNKHAWRPALTRFAEKCAFDPVTGCVMWVGGKTQGHGHSQPYGAFRDQGFRWYAHRWAAHHIHGFDITGLQVDHCCPAGPSTLCVEHVRPLTQEANRYLQNVRPGRAWQDLATKQFWLLVAKGYEQPPERIERPAGGIPFFEPPLWLQPFLKQENFDDCPF